MEKNGGGWTVSDAKGTIKNEQPRDTGNIGHKTRNEGKQKKKKKM
jgi:hypothetical protein